MEKAHRIKSLFMTFFDGCFDIEPQIHELTTLNLGVCKLDYNDDNDTLTVHLRRPSLIIGKQGRTINQLTQYLNCKIHIKEVDLLTS